MRLTRLFHPSPLAVTLPKGGVESNEEVVLWIFGGAIFAMSPTA
jgi:hypothetical protein